MNSSFEDTLDLISEDDLDLDLNLDLEDEHDPAEGVSTISETARTVVAVYVTFLAMGAAGGNILYLVTISTNKMLRRNPLNILVTNLALANTGTALFSYPNLAAANYTGRWLYGHVGCTLDAFLTFSLSIVSLNTLVAIAIFRYVTMCKVDLKPLIGTRRAIVGMSLVIWLYSLLWTTCPFLGWSDYTYEPYGTSCTVDWAGRKKETVAYNICLIIFCYIVHLSILIFCYWKICIMMVAAYVVCWTPYALMSTLSMFISLPTNSTVLPTLFAKLSPCLDPTIYILLNRTMKANKNTVNVAAA